MGNDGVGKWDLLGLQGFDFDPILPEFNEETGEFNSPPGFVPDFPTLPPAPPFPPDLNLNTQTPEATDPNDGLICFKCVCKGSMNFSYSPESRDRYFAAVLKSGISDADKALILQTITALSPRPGGEDKSPIYEGTGHSSSIAGALLQATLRLKTDMRTDFVVQTQFFWEYRSANFEKCECTKAESDIPRPSL